MFIVKFANNFKTNINTEKHSVHKCQEITEIKNPHSRAEN